MKGKDFKIFLEALSELENEKGIEKEKILETIETALLAAYKKNFGDDTSAKIEINRDTGEVRVYTEKTVVSKVNDEINEISLKEAKKIEKDIKKGEIIRIEEKCDTFRRNAVQNAKQIVIQKVREEERETMFKAFKHKEGKIVNGVIRRIDERGNVYIDFNKTEAVLPSSEQSPLDRYRVGERMKVYVVEVMKSTKAPKVTISRKHEGFLRKMFEFEVPEVEDGVIKVMGIAREAGSRSKISVFSKDENIDTVGACIGQKGMRIRAIVDELNGEKIDVVNWEKDKVKYIANALAPAKIKSVEIMDNNKFARVLVQENQLSLAIGKSGQNARLAAKLTGMKIDIKIAEATIKQENTEKTQEIDITNEEETIET